MRRRGIRHTEGHLHALKYTEQSGFTLYSESYLGPQTDWINLRGALFGLPLLDFFSTEGRYPVSEAWGGSCGLDLLPENSWRAVFCNTALIGTRASEFPTAMIVFANP